MPSPIPALPGRAVNTAFPTWALLNKRSSPEPTIPCYSDTIGQDWIVSFSAIIGFFDKNAIEPWIPLGFVVTRDKTFFKKQTNDKMYSITLSINSSYLDGKVVKRACELLNGYVHKANDAKHTCVFPYLQIFVSQLPTQTLRRLSTQLERRDYEFLEAHTICYCPGIDKDIDYIERILAAAARHNAYAAFIRQFFVLRASPLQYQSIINSLRLSGVDLPESACRGALQIVPRETCPGTLMPLHMHQLQAHCPSVAHEVHLQCFFTDRCASIEDVRQELQALGAPPTYMRIAQIEGDAHSIISAVHATVPTEAATSMWEAYSRSHTTIVLQYFSKEVNVSVPTHARRACLETPLEHWCRYSNQHEAPVTRLTFILPADRNDRVALDRTSYAIKTDTLGCECIWTQEQLPVMHLSTGRAVRQEFPALVKAAIKHYATIAGAGETVAPAAPLLQNAKGIKFVNGQTSAPPETPSYAVLQVTGRDAIRIPKFERKEGSLQVTYQGTILIGNFIVRTLSRRLPSCLRAYWWCCSRTVGLCSRRRLPP